jgi:hypothetical protein
MKLTNFKTELFIAEVDINIDFTTNVKIGKQGGGGQKM